MGKKVFLVTSGSYSDYGVRACFSTRAKANVYLANWKSVDRWHEDMKIETMDLDGPAKVITYVEIRINKAGEITRRDIERGMADDVHIGYGGVADPTMNGCINVDSNELCWSVETDSIERAEKVIAEKRAEVLAAGIWGQSGKMNAYFRGQ